MANKSGRQQRRLLALDLQAEQSRMTGPGTGTATGLEGLLSPDSDASSGGHRFMYGHGGRNIGIGMTASEDDHSDKRSSTSSTGWMMKNPLRQPLVTRAGEAPGQGIQLTIDTHAPTSKNDPNT